MRMYILRMETKQECPCADPSVTFHGVFSTAEKAKEAHDDLWARLVKDYEYNYDEAFDPVKHKHELPELFVYEYPVDTLTNLPSLLPR